MTEWLSVAQIARSLHVSKMTIYRAIHARELRAVRVGRQFRVTAEEARLYLVRMDTMLDEFGAAS